MTFYTKKILGCCLLLTNFVLTFKPNTVNSAKVTSAKNQLEPTKDQTDPPNRKKAETIVCVT